MTESIAVGIDGTTAARAAMLWAVGRAARDGLAVELVTVVDDDWGSVPVPDLERMRQSAVTMLEAESGLAAAAADVRLSSTLLVGDPMNELAEHSRHARMVVVGTHKTGFFHGHALGSRSLQLASIAWTPVAVIPEFSGSLRGGIVVGVDDSDAGTAAVTFGSAESAVSGEGLVLVHARATGAVPVANGRGVSALAAETVATGATGATLVRTREIRRPAAEALIDVARTARLLVIGSSRRRGRMSSALGPVSHDVLMNISGPTIVVHGGMTSRQP